jgi:phenylpyruvate tautomerase PptA (4-oxalocrotonate tautomerase family)
MPFITVEMTARSVDARRAFAQAVVEAAGTHLGAPVDRVRVRFVEIKPDELFRNGALMSDGEAGS